MSLSHVWLFATPWTVAYQASLSMGFSKQEYPSGLPFPSPEDVPDPEIKPGSPALRADALPSEPSGRLMKRKVNWSSKLQCCLILKNCQICPSVTTTLISQQTLHWGKTLYQQKHYDSLKTQMTFITFQHKTFFFFLFWLCGAACRILVPQPGIEPVTPAVDVWSPKPLGYRRIPSEKLFLN